MRGDTVGQVLTPKELIDIDSVVMVTEEKCHAVKTSASSQKLMHKHNTMGIDFLLLFMLLLRSIGRMIGITDTEEATCGSASATNFEEMTISGSNNHGSGMFVDCELGGVCIPLLLDTGASRTIISEEIYQKIPEDCRPPVLQGVQCTRLQMADGTPLGTLGCVRAQLQLDCVRVEHDVIVADITDPGILGVDFMKKHDCQIDLGSGALTIGGQLVAVRGMPTTQVHRVTVRECVIPRLSEVLIPVSSDVYKDESSSEFEENHHLEVAASGDDGSGGSVSTEDDAVHQGTMRNQAEAVDKVVCVLQNNENSSYVWKCVSSYCQADTAELSWPDSSESHAHQIPDTVKVLRYVVLLDFQSVIANDGKCNTELITQEMKESNYDWVPRALRPLDPG